MKVAVTVQQFSETQGGAERAAVELVRGLRLQGIEVDIYARKISENIDLCGATPFVVPCLNLSSAIRHVSFASNVHKMLMGQKYDIIHAFTRTYYADVYRIGGGCHKEYLRRTSVKKGPLGRFLTKLNLKHMLMTKLEKKSFQKGAWKKIVAVSERCKQEILDNYDVAEEDIKVIYNGVNLSKFNPENKKYRNKVRGLFGLKEDDYVILFCGNGFRTKGLGFALESLSIASKECDARLVVAGRGNPAPYRKLAYRLGLKDRIYFLGARDNMHELYGAVDLLLHPSLHDPFPNVVLEAMATGIPVITTKVTGTAEIITNNLDSIVVDHASDIYQVSQSIKNLADKVIRKRMGDEAYKLAQRFTREKNIAANIELYGQVLTRVP